MSKAVPKHEEWTVTNTEHDVVTCDLWLDAALTRHRDELAADTSAEVQLQYVVNGVDLDLDVQQIRGVMDWLYESYRTNKRVEQTTRAARDALLEQMSAQRVMPSEIVLMAGVDQVVAERFAGDETEARIARQLLHKLAPPGGAAALSR